MSVSFCPLRMQPGGLPQRSAEHMMLLPKIVDSTTEFVDMPSTPLRNAAGDAVHSSVRKDQDDAMPSSVEALSVGYFFAILSENLNPSPASQSSIL